MLHLADSSIGFLLILGVMLVVGGRHPLPFLGHSLEPLLHRLANNHALLLLFAVLLAKPAGILTSEAGKLLISWYEPMLVRLLLNLPEKMFALFSGVNLVPHDELKQFFNIREHQEAKAENFCSTARFFEAYLNVFLGEQTASSRVSVVMSLARSMAFLTFFSFLSYLHVAFWNNEVSFSLLASCLVMLLTLFFSLLYAFMASLCCLQSLSALHALCREHGISNEYCLSPHDLIEMLHAACFGGGEEKSRKS